MKRSLGITLVAVAMILSILACGGGSSPTAVPEKPTAEPVAELTVEVPEEPTKLVKPTKAPKATEEAPTEEPTAEPTSGGDTVDCANVPDGEVGVAYDRGYKDLSDNWRVIGLICNNSSEAVSNVKLSIEVFDTKENSIHLEEDVYTALYNIDAGEGSPFGVSIWDDLPDADTYTVAVEDYDTTTVDRPEGLDVQGVMLTVDNDGEMHITGELINNGDQPVEIHGLAAITIDDEGQMESSDYYSVLIHYLNPGKTGPFRVSTTAPADGATASEWTVYFDAETTSDEEFLISAADDSSDLNEYFDAYGDYHMAGTVTNNGTDNVGVRLLATLYDADGNVLDAAMTDTAISAIEPGETIPYIFDYWGPVESADGVYDAYDNWRVQVDPSWTWSTSTSLVDLSDEKSTVVDSNEFDDYQGTFKGKVTNTTAGDLSSIVVIVSIWPKAGQPDEGQMLTMSYTYADISDKLAKGKSADFTVYVPIPEGFVVDDYEYEVIAKGSKP